MDTHPPDASSPFLTVDGEGIARLVFDDPERSANVLTERVMIRLASLVEELQAPAERGEVRGLLITSAKVRSFIVGADIEAIARVESPEEGARGARLGQDVFLALERLPIPTVAAIDGSCMGGGVELALACSYRVASDDPRTRLAFPEVLLGILPAWGGTTRLPRLIGLRAAVDLLLTGREIDARRAHRTGVVDELLPSGSFERFADGFLRRIVREGSSRRARRVPTLTRRLESSGPGRRLVLAVARRRVLRESGGHYPAPLRILEVLQESHGHPIEAALAKEADAAGELVASEVSRNLVHLFRLREDARKGRSIPRIELARPVRGIGILGAGIMGGGIAQLAAYRGIPVRLRDLRYEAVTQALRHADALLEDSVRRRRLTAGDAGRALGRISGGVELTGFGATDLVVEAVVEKLDVKRAVLAEVEGLISRDCVLATNTSSLSVDRIAEGLTDPERFLGLHFFNPVHRMPLVEIVRGRATSDEAAATAWSFAVRLGKVPVLVRDGPGFLVNRVLGPYLNEAGILLGEGAAVEEIDGAARAFGMPMGPLRLIDEIGIDIAVHAGRSLHEALGDRMTPASTLERLGASGRLGRKGGVGIYRYEKGKEKGVDPELYDVAGVERPAGAGSRGGTRREGSGPTREEIRDRLLLAMVNEAARVLWDKIAETAGDVDLAMVMGTGFPPFRGGLLRMADERHPRAVVELLQRLEARGAARFAPAPLLLQLARDDRGFYDVFPGRG